MPMVSFDNEIRDIEAQLEQEREELRELEEQYSGMDVELDELREALASLRRASSGKSRPRTRARAVEVNPETGRPSRGARREQLMSICRSLGRGGNVFRTVEVLERVRDIEGEVSAGVRSYTYSSMATFAEEGLLEKVGRGRWRLA